MRSIGSFLFIFILAYTPWVASSEVDQYTTLQTDLRDSTVELNAWFNSALAMALVKLNKTDHKCSPDFLMKNIVKEMKLGNWAAFEYDLDKHPSVDRIPAEFKSSIYRDAEFTETPVLWSGRALAPVIKVNGIRIGSDKLGHFFNQGFFYFTDPNHLPIDDSKLFRTAYGIVNGPAYKLSEVRANKTAALFSHTEENGSMGLSMNGVKSWGDIAAGYDGFLFWSNFYGKDKSIIRCENGKFVQNYKFDWKNWVSKAWDETINCNEYSDKLGKSVTKRINDLEIKWNRKLNCPLEPNTCGDLTLRYMEVFPLVLNPNCRDLSKVTRLNENLKKLAPPKKNCP